MRITKFFMAVAALFAFVAISAGEAQAQVATADARPFIGVWSLPLQGEAPTTVTVDIHDHDGQLMAVVTGDAGPAQVQRVSKSGDNLVLNYQRNLQGQNVPLVLTLTPEGDNLRGVLDVAGLMTMRGTATKRQ
jgi:hypothetical protein